MALSRQRLRFAHLVSHNSLEECQFFPRVNYSFRIGSILSKQTSWPILSSPSRKLEKRMMDYGQQLRDNIAAKGHNGVEHRWGDTYERHIVHANFDKTFETMALLPHNGVNTGVGRITKFVHSLAIF